MKLIDTQSWHLTSDSNIHSTYFLLTLIFTSIMELATRSGTHSFAPTQTSFEIKAEQPSSERKLK